MSCTAADVKKIAPGRENCVEIVRRTLPARVAGDSEKLIDIGENRGAFAHGNGVHGARLASCLSPLRAGEAREKPCPSVPWFFLDCLG